MATNTVSIKATPAKVFDVLADGWTFSNWVVGTSHIRAVEADWPARGTRIHHASGLWPAVVRDETVVESCDPGARLVLIAKSRPMGEARVVLELAEDPAGCLVGMHEAPISGAGRAMHNALSEALLVRRNTESLARLAAICERRTVPVE